jgi:hypothetical protein
MRLLALALSIQGTQAVQPSPDEAAVTFPDGIGHIGSFIPNAQLLSWCTSKVRDEQSYCRIFIKGVVDAAGMIDVGFPSGPIDTSKIEPLKEGEQTYTQVVSFLQSIPNAQMANPAARSVYTALAAKYPYTGVHRHEIPFNPKQIVKPQR